MKAAARAASAAFAVLASATAPAGSLTVERLENPVGIDVPAPRLGWKLTPAEGRRNLRQTAYRVLVASTPERLEAGEGDLWDSGRIEDGRTFDIPYAGKPLTSSQRVFWKVKTWDSSGGERWSEAGEWTAGVIGKDGWRAKWIGGHPRTFDTVDMTGAKWIRSADTNGCTKTFRLAAKPKGEVELAFSARGEYRLYVNGSLFEQSQLCGEFSRRLRFFNVGPYLRAGENVITVRPYWKRVSWPDDRDITFVCRLTAPDGTAVATDGSWSGATELGGFRETEWGRGTRADVERVSPAFRRTFTVSKPVKSAVLHITAPGFYEASLNGCRIGDRVLDPAPTDYTKRVLYSSYRLDDAVRVGENTLDVLLGHGWYDVRSLAYWNYDCAKWTASPRMIAQLDIEHADGTRATVVSDGSWRHIPSPVGYDCIREGEVIGARDPRGVDVAEEVLPAAEVQGPAGRLVAGAFPAAKVVGEVAPSAIRETADGWVIEFPHNIAGWIRLRVRGAAKGDRIILRYDERLMPDGSPEKARRQIDDLLVSQSHRVTGERLGAQQQDVFYPGGAAEETYAPRFTYSGFRYVWVRGLRTRPSPADVVGCEVRTSFRRTGSFVCSDQTFNRLIEIADRSYRSNFTDGHPTDCPQREKLAWTGDAAIAAHFGTTFYDTAAVYEKWTCDMADCQRADGCLPVIAPTGGWGFQWGTGPVWDSALAVVPAYLRDRLGDRRASALAYPALVRYIDYVERRAGGPIVTWGLSDWLSNGSEPSVAYVSSCYHMLVLGKARQMAAELGRTDEAGRFARLAERSRQAIRGRFRREDGTWDNGSQTAQALPIVLGLAEPSERDSAAGRLVASVTKAKDHIAFGMIGSRYVFEALGEIGRADLAWRMIMQPDGVSYAHQLADGQTTLPEHWDYGKSGSLNHAMHCDYATWAVEYLGGVRRPADGYGTFLVAPQPIDALDWVKTSFETPRGTVASAWRREKGFVIYEITVPPTASARVRLPGRGEMTLGSGDHVFREPVIAKETKK